MAPPVRPSAAIQAAYTVKLDRLVNAMQADIMATIVPEYQAAQPLATDAGALTVDASPAMVLRAAMRRLARKWLKRFDELAPAISRWFATDVTKRSDQQLKAIFRDHQFTVRFKPTRAMNEAFQAVVGENVALIKSIPAEHLKNIEGDVMRSVQTGRDLGSLATALTQTYGVTKRRAAFIARSQNNQATAVMERARALDLGLTKARWLHSAGGKVPRPEHVNFSGQIYDIREGAPVEGGWPGVAINCRCVSVPVIPGFD